MIYYTFGNIILLFLLDSADVACQLLIVHRPVGSDQVFPRRIHRSFFNKIQRNILNSMIHRWNPFCDKNTNQMFMMTKFPIKIDLSEFFDDERKMVLLLVDPDWENIEGLQRRVHKVFNIGAVSFTTIDSCFIPPTESIEMLHYLDMIKAFKSTQLNAQRIKLTNVELAAQLAQHRQSQLQSAQATEGPWSTKSKSLNASKSNSQNSKMPKSFLSHDTTSKRKCFSLDQTSEVGAHQPTKRAKYMPAAELPVSSPPSSPIKHTTPAGRAQVSSPSQIVLPAKIITSDNSTYSYCGTISADELFRSRVSSDGNTTGGDAKANNSKEQLPPVEVVDINMDLEEQSAIVNQVPDKKQRKRNKKAKKDLEAACKADLVSESQEIEDAGKERCAGSGSVIAQSEPKAKTKKHKKAKERQKNELQRQAAKGQNAPNHRYFNDDGEFVTPPADEDDASSLPANAVVSSSGSTSASTQSKMVFFCTLDSFNTEQPRVFDVATLRDNELDEDKDLDNSNNTSKTESITAPLEIIIDQDAEVESNAEEVEPLAVTQTELSSSSTPADSTLVETTSAQSSSKLPIEADESEHANEEAKEGKPERGAQGGPAANESKAKAKKQRKAKEKQKNEIQNGEDTYKEANQSNVDAVSLVDGEAEPLNVSAQTKKIFFCTLDTFSSEKQRVFDVAESRSDSATNNNNNNNKNNDTLNGNTIASRSQNIEILDEQILGVATPTKSVIEGEMQVSRSGDVSMGSTQNSTKTLLNSTANDTQLMDGSNELTISSIVIDVDEVTKHDRDMSISDGTVDNTTVNSAIVIDLNDTTLEEINDDFKECDSSKIPSQHDDSDVHSTSNSYFTANTSENTSDSSSFELTPRSVKSKLITNLSEQETPTVKKDSE